MNPYSAVVIILAMYMLWKVFDAIYEQ